MGPWKMRQKRTLRKLKLILELVRQNLNARSKIPISIQLFFLRFSTDTQWIKKQYIFDNQNQFLYRKAIIIQIWSNVVHYDNRFIQVCNILLDKRQKVQYSYCCLYMKKIYGLFDYSIRYNTISLRLNKQYFSEKIKNYF